MFYLKVGGPTCFLGSLLMTNGEIFFLFNFIPAVKLTNTDQFVIVAR